jgi:glycosyltransferase involved in cell wall biosynthesis
LKISIITVSRNNSKTIGDTVKSVLGQDYPELEYIVIDGNSVDGTQDIVSGFGDRIHHFTSEPDQGVYDAMNKGIRLASGDIVGFLHADDFYSHVGVIKNLADVFSRSGCDAVYGDLAYVSQTDPGKITRIWQSGPYRKEKFLAGWMPPHPAFFLQRKCYLEFGTFNTGLSSAADYELMLRMLFKHGLKAAYLPERLVTMRSGGISNRNLKNRFHAHKEDRLAWKINDLKPKFYTFWAKPIRKVPQFLGFPSS